MINKSKTTNGFELCEFEDEVCEKCNTPVKEIYFRSTNYFDCREGEYWCLSCVQKELRENEESIAYNRKPICFNVAELPWS